MPNTPARRRWDRTTDPAARTAATAPARAAAARRFADQVDPDQTLDALHELAGGQPVVDELAAARRRRHMAELAATGHRARRAARFAAERAA